MITLRKILSTALVATTLSTAAVATTTTAEARGGAFWGGLAVGAMGGIIASQAMRPAYAEPVYVYRPTCHKEWRYDYYGNAYKVKVCD